MNENEAQLCPHYINGLWIKLMKLAGSNIIDANSSQPITCPVDHETFLTEFLQPLQVQSHLEMPGILVQLGHTQHT